jgi:hypothetical protein
MNNCESCGHKESALSGCWCFIKATRPAGNTCMMWTQGKEKPEFEGDFEDIFNKFFGGKKK